MTRSYVGVGTIQQLTLRHQTLKLEMYKAFFIVIGVAAALSILMVLYQVQFFLFFSLFRVQRELLVAVVPSCIHDGRVVAERVDL